jgi:hypothetical protein
MPQRGKGNQPGGIPPGIGHAPKIMQPKNQRPERATEISRVQPRRGGARELRRVAVHGNHAHARESWRDTMELWPRTQIIAIHENLRQPCHPPI